MQIYQLCVTFEIESKEEKNKKFVDEVSIIISNLGSELMTQKDSADKRKEDMKGTISSMIPILKSKVDAFNNEILHEKYLDIKSNLFTTLTEIDNLEKICILLVDEAKKIQEF